MSRDFRIDNAKGVMIILVVIGHVIEQLTSSWSSKQVSAILYFIWCVHMPAFIMLAGITYNPKKYIQNSANIMMLYLVFNFTYQWDLIYSGRFTVDHFLYSAWGMWFLETLFTLMIISHFLIKIKGALFISIVISLLSGFLKFDGYILSISRTLVFLPFFIFGVIYKCKVFEIKNTSVIFIYTILCMVMLDFSIDKKWLYGGFFYWQMNELSIDRFMYPAIRLCIMAVSFLGCISFISFSKNNNTIITKIGRNCLSIYIIHFFIINLIKIYLPINIKEINVYEQIIFAIITSILICLILSPDIINKTIRKIMIFGSKKRG